jgi:hypothetical protein
MFQLIFKKPYFILIINLFKIIHIINTNLHFKK